MKRSMFLLMLIAIVLVLPWLRDSQAENQELVLFGATDLLDVAIVVTRCGDRGANAANVDVARIRVHRNFDLDSAGEVDTQANAPTNGYGHARQPQRDECQGVRDSTCGIPQGRIRA